ncbi:MAG: MMPL family transporter, partial [Spirochaetia bacterium]
MRRLTSFVFTHRRSIIAVFLALTVFFAWWIKDLRINSDMVSYLPQEDPAVRLFQHVGERFGQNDLVLVAVVSEDIFTPRTIKDIALLTDRFAGVEGVSGVISLTNVMDISRALDGGIEIGRLVDPDALPATDEQVRALRASVMGRERYRGAILSEDGCAALIVCRTRSGADTTAMVHRIQAAAASSGVDEKLLFGGNPLFVTELGAIIFHDLKLLVPIVAVLIILTLFLAFGTLRGVLVPLSAVAMSTIWVLGLMGLLRCPLTLVSDIIPALLFAIGTAPCIHILSKFDEDVSRYGSAREESQGAFREVGVRVILAALTIVLGFSSFIVGSYLTAIRDFGIFSSIGVLFSLLISLMFVPAVVASMKVRPRAVRDNPLVRRGGAAVEKVMGAWAGTIVRHPRALVAASAVALAFGIAGIPFIRREVDFTTFVGPQSPVRVTEALLQREFGGSRPLQVVFTGDMEDPMVLKDMLCFQRFITANGLAKNATSIADIIAEMNGIVDGEKMIPDDRARVSNL